MDLTKVLQSLTKPAVNAAQMRAYQLHVQEAKAMGEAPLPYDRWVAAQTNALAAPVQQAAPQNQLAEPPPFRF